MSTKFPDNIQTFGQFQDMTYNDWEMLAQYRKAMADSDFATAQQALRGISRLKNKLLTNGFMNDMLDTCYAVQDFFDNRQVPDYIVSAVEPVGQKKGDLWFESPIATSAIKFHSKSSFSISIDLGGSITEGPWDGTIKYSSDGDNWNVWDGSTTLSSGTLNGESVLYFIGEGNTKVTFKKTSETSGRVCSWVLNGNDIHCDGNLENLLDYKIAARGEHPVMDEYAFASMFANNKSLVSAPEMLSLVISKEAYSSMFYGCENLSTVPSILPASIVPVGAYAFMFFGCHAITTPPIMTNIKEIQKSGCSSMFSNCDSMEKVPQMNVSTFGDSACDWMFSSCFKLKFSETKDSEYTNAYNGCFGESFGTDCFKYMFSSTKGTFAGTPTANTTYYTSNEVI